MGLGSRDTVCGTPTPGVFAWRWLRLGVGGSHRTDDAVEHGSPFGFGQRQRRDKPHGPGKFVEVIRAFSATSSATPNLVARKSSSDRV